MIEAKSVGLRARVYPMADAIDGLACVTDEVGAATVSKRGVTAGERLLVEIDWAEVNWRVTNAARHSEGMMGSSGQQKRAA